MKTLILGLIFLTTARKTYAYLDPGTGSYIFQILIAGLLGSTFFLKSAIKKIINKFRKKNNDET